MFLTAADQESVTHSASEVQSRLLPLHFVGENGLMGNSVRQKCATPFGAEYTLYVKTVGVVENDTDESST